jgi:deoxyribodipyrimidine photo-lyase
MNGRTSIVWFRNDLRLHDNESLIKAISSSDNIIPVYVFDTRLFLGKTSFGFPKTGKYRAQFLIESVESLKSSLKEKGCDLIIRTGIPEEEIFNIAQQVKSFAVFCNRERTSEEVRVQDALEKRLWTIGQELIFSRGKMLFHTGDLPFPVAQTPDIFSQFRKEVEKYVPVRNPLSAPDSIPYKDFGIHTALMPTLNDFGWEIYQSDKRSAFPFKGGEKAALERLKYYFWDSKLVREYKETRNGLIGTDYSSKFSPYLSSGCISPKLIFAELKKFEKQYGENDSTYWLFFELMWRDFFRFMGKKHGNKMFLPSGTATNQRVNLDFKPEIFDKWANGNTGEPFVDANMIELKLTGFMSNRGRQNVASYLVNDLKQNWMAGAEYFESLLIDYDPCSNYGNWNYLAGVGSDPRENRVFNIATQVKKYDPEERFIQLWQ